MNHVSLKTAGKKHHIYVCMRSVKILLILLLAHTKTDTCLLASIYAQGNVHKGILGSSHTVHEAAFEDTMSSLAELAVQSTEAEASESKAVPNHESLCSVVVAPTFVPPSFNFVNGSCLDLLN